MPNVKDSQLRRTVKSAREFIEDIHTAININDGSLNAGARWDERLGQLTLSVENLNRQSGIIDKLHDAVRGKPTNVWSGPAVKKQFETALYSALGIFPRDQGDFSIRLDTAIDDLNNSLRQPLRDWQFAFPILGLRVVENELAIANVSFEDSNEANLGTLRKRVNDILQETLHTETEKEAMQKSLYDQIDRIFSRTTIATVSVRAAEKLAAKQMAHQDLLEVVDVLNYFSIALYPADLRVSIRLPNEARFGRHEILSFESDQNFSMDFTNEGPIQPFDLSTIDEATASRIGLTRMQEIMLKPMKSELDRSVITAARTAGKASFAGRREDAFLLFAIAIESLIVGGDEKTDLTYKLSTRCAHLLGDNLQSRIRIRDDLKKLYGIRSGIVHRGQSSFPDSELRTIRSYALRTIRSFLTNDELQRIEKKEDLAVWFDNRVLS